MNAFPEIPWVDGASVTERSHGGGVISPVIANKPVLIVLWLE